MKNIRKINCFQSAYEFLRNRNRRNVRGIRSTYVQKGPLGEIAVYYHATPVVTYWPSGRIVLRTGGHRSVTTKKRINEFTNIRVFQSKFEWFCQIDGKTIPFAEHMNVGPVKIYDFKNRELDFSWNIVFHSQEKSQTLSKINTLRFYLTWGDATGAPKMPDVPQAPEYYLIPKVKLCKNRHKNDEIYLCCTYVVGERGWILRHVSYEARIDFMRHVCFTEARMKLLPQKPVDEEGDNDTTTYLVHYKGVQQLMARKAIRQVLTEGESVTAASKVKIPPELQSTNGHSPTPQKRKTSKMSKMSRVAARQGRGFTREEQLRGAVAGGKARAKALTKAQRREAARKAVLARWRKHRNAKRQV